MSIDRSLSQVKIKLLLTLPIISVLMVSCSTTPGDAAYGGGHPEQAAELYRRGAEQGDSSAALKLGLLLNNGEASSAVYGAPVDWFDRACQLGDSAGCHNAGLAYEYGEKGVAKDYSKARFYYLEAAQRGYPQAQYNLGSLYANNYFNNDLEGYKWILLATKQAESCKSNPLCEWILNDPPGHRTTLRNRLPQHQINTAHEFAGSWKPKPAGS